MRLRTEYQISQLVTEDLGQLNGQCLAYMCEALSFQLFEARTPVPPSHS